MSSVPEPEGRDRDLLEIGAWVSTSSGPALLWRLQSHRHHRPIVHGDVEQGAGRGGPCPYRFIHRREGTRQWSK
jgi:hypothetical protein